MLSALVHAQVSNDPFDVTNGVKITKASPTIPGTGPEGMFGGNTGYRNNTVEKGNTLFVDAGTDKPYFVEFTTPKPVTIKGIVEYVARDTNRSRTAYRIRFYPDQNNNGNFDDDGYRDTGTNPLDTSVDESTGKSSKYVCTFSGPPCKASRFRIEFWAKPGVKNPGPRVVEIDAIPG